MFEDDIKSDDPVWCDVIDNMPVHVSHSSFPEWKTSIPSNTESVFDDWRCFLCGSTDPQNLQESVDSYVCLGCGAVQKDLGHVMLDALSDEDFQSSSNISFYSIKKRDKDGNVIKGKTSYGTAARRRYKRKFYYRERMAQWMCQEPPVKPATMRIFEDILESGKYGGKRYLSRGVIFQMCKDEKLCKYKENWKSILYSLKHQTPPVPDSHILHFCTLMFARISKRFDGLNKLEMSKFLKGSKGKPRHHILHVNYVHRKLMEVYGCTDFHREFPLLRTPSKIDALDDVMQMIAAQTQMPFSRTAIVIPPKYKNKHKIKPFSVS
jgi:hypothetical protein